MRLISFVAAAACLALVGCANPASTINLPSPSGAPAPISSALDVVNRATTACDATSIDETILTSLWRAFDGYLDWIDGQHLAYGSPKALATLRAERRIRSTLEGITSVHNACSGGSWSGSLAALKAAYTDAQNAIR